MNDRLAYGLIATIVIVFLMMARILHWWLKPAFIRTVRLALKVNFILLVKYTGAILLLAIISEMNDSGTTDEKGWPDLFPAFCIILWGIIFLIHILVLWIIAEINLLTQVIKNKSTGIKN
ncbi:hypothetical protein BH09BAC5_BH09BAC5_29020 [soil metagenome]